MVAVAFEGVGDDLGIDEIILQPRRGCRFRYAHHAGGVFTNVVCDVGHIVALLQKQVGPFEVIVELIKLLPPCVLAVELVAEPCVDTRQRGIVGLRYIKMQKCLVDPFGEKAVTAQLEVAGGEGKLGGGDSK